MANANPAPPPLIATPTPAAGDVNGGNNRSILQNGVIALNAILLALQNAFPNTTGGTSGSATGGAATLPANPTEFLVITMPDGSIKKVPLYDE